MLEARPVRAAKTRAQEAIVSWYLPHLIIELNKLHYFSTANNITEIEETHEIESEAEKPEAKNYQEIIGQRIGIEDGQSKYKIGSKKGTNKKIAVRFFPSLGVALDNNNRPLVFSIFQVLQDISNNATVITKTKSKVTHSGWLHSDSRLKLFFFFFAEPFQKEQRKQPIDWKKSETHKNDWSHSTQIYRSRKIQRIIYDQLFVITSFTFIRSSWQVNTVAESHEWHDHKSVQCTFLHHRRIWLVYRKWDEWRSNGTIENQIETVFVWYDRNGRFHRRRGRCWTKARQTATTACMESSSKSQRNHFASIEYSDEYHWQNVRSSNGRRFAGNFSKHF